MGINMDFSNAQEKLTGAVERTVLATTARDIDGTIDVFVPDEASGEAVLKVFDSNGKLQHVFNNKKVTVEILQTALAANESLVQISDGYAQLTLSNENYGAGSSIEISFGGNLRGSAGLNVQMQSGDGDEVAAYKGEQGGRLKLTVPMSLS